VTTPLKSLGVGTDYLNAMVYIKEFLSQAYVDTYRGKSDKTAGD